MSEMSNVIYMHYNTASMKSYIGLTTKTMEARWKEHLINAFKTNVDGSWFYDWKFYRAIRKYPLDSWSHIELYQYKDDGTELPIEEYEKFFINKHDTYVNGYNSTLGGEGVNRMSKIASRKDSVKGYSWDNRKNTYNVRIRYLHRTLCFGSFTSEDDAKTKAKYILLLNDEDLLKAHEEYMKADKGKTKGYSFEKKTGKWRVRLSVNSVSKYFGDYKTEEEAIAKVKEVKEELGI